MKRDRGRRNAMRRRQTKSYDENRMDLDTQGAELLFSLIECSIFLEMDLACRAK